MSDKDTKIATDDQMREWVKMRRRSATPAELPQLDQIEQRIDAHEFMEKFRREYR
jgi:hypothetical protein